MIWIFMILAGIITYLMRSSMITIINSEMLSERVKNILNYVPSSVFPAMIFPAVLLNDNINLAELNDAKVIAALISIGIGYLSQNVVATIFSGLFSYWFLIFLF